MGWLGDLLYMDKTFDEAMAKRGYMNTTIRNKKYQKIICWANIFSILPYPCFTNGFCWLVGHKIIAVFGIGDYLVKWCVYGPYGE